MAPQGNNNTWLNQLDLAQPVYLFELKLAAVMQRVIPHFDEIPKFPSIKRDLAIVVDEKVTARDIEETIWSAAPKILRDLTLFDVFVAIIGRAF